MKPLGLEFPAVPSMPDDPLPALLVVIAFAAAYWLPTVVAAVRDRQWAAVAVLNTFLGWTGVFWVLSLALAVSRPMLPPAPSGAPAGPAAQAGSAPGGPKEESTP